MPGRTALLHASCSGSPPALLRHQVTPTCGSRRLLRYKAPERRTPPTPRRGHAPRLRKMQRRAVIRPIRSPTRHGAAILCGRGRRGRERPSEPASQTECSISEDTAMPTANAAIAGKMRCWDSIASMVGCSCRGARASAASASSLALPPTLRGCQFIPQNSAAPPGRHPMEIHVCAANCRLDNSTINYSRIRGGSDAACETLPQDGPPHASMYPSSSQHGTEVST